MSVATETTSVIRRRDCGRPVDVDRPIDEESRVSTAIQRRRYLADHVRRHNERLAREAYRRGISPSALPPTAAQIREREERATRADERRVMIVIAAIVVLGLLVWCAA